MTPLLPLNSSQSSFSEANDLITVWSICLGCYFFKEKSHLGPQILTGSQSQFSHFELTPSPVPCITKEGIVYILKQQYKNLTPWSNQYDNNCCSTKCPSSSPAEIGGGAKSDCYFTQPCLPARRPVSSPDGFCLTDGVSFLQHYDPGLVVVMVNLAVVIFYFQTELLLLSSVHQYVRLTFSVVAFILLLGLFSFSFPFLMQLV